MQIKLNKNVFTNQFLLPISKIVGDDESNKGCVIDILDNYIECVSNTCVGSSIILYSKIITSTGLSQNETSHLNIFDIRKFIKLLECISEDEIVLQINSNNLTYKSNNMNFKFHLMDDGVIRKSVVNVDKLNKLAFNNEFSITKSKIDEIMRISCFLEDSNKLYLSCKNKEIVGELTDKTKPNINSVEIQISSGFIGESFNDLPISLDILKKLSGLKYDLINVKVNTQTGVLMIELSNNDCILKYVITALVK